MNQPLYQVLIQHIFLLLLNYLNPLQAFLPFSLSFIIGAVVGLISLPFTKNHEMPFCPYMALGSFVAIMWWLPLINVFLYN